MKSLTLAEAAELISAQLVGNPDHIITGVDDLASASDCDISFLSHPRYFQAMRRSKAGAILAEPTIELPCGRNFLLVKDPSFSFQSLIGYFYDRSKTDSAFTGVHPTAVIHPSVKLGTNVSVGPHAVIDCNVCIGDGTIVSAGVFIGSATSIGEKCVIYPHATIREGCTIGNRVILQPGCVIGSCGFGFSTSKDGQHIKLEQVGSVVIEDDVEIGANTTIDRARFRSTRIGQGTKIDNQVQIAHGVQIGPNNLLCAQVGIAGSTQTDSGVILGGQVGVLGHIRLGKNVRVAACSGVSKSLEKGDFSGIPAVPVAEYNRNAVYVRNLESHIQKLEKKIQDFESRIP
jgi:UDP-3-O-[3-hydroxymyristoyl] glucosamine N-acyltransferase